MALGLVGGDGGHGELEVEGGEGQFNQARSFIISNFTISEAGVRSVFDWA